MADETSDKGAKSPWLTGLRFAVFQWGLGAVVAIVVGVGTVRYTEGAREQRLASDETQLADLKAENSELRKLLLQSYVTKDELKAYVESQTAVETDIQTNVRDLRNFLMNKGK